ncbi:MAG: KEOPS complex subunit Pcc1 [Candidatus Bathyarchaeia archaeon]
MMEAKITIVYKDAKEAKAISAAVSPDNIKTPQSIHIDTSATDTHVVTSIKYDGDNIMTFSSTIDDFLGCVSVAEKTFSALKKKG